MNTQDFYTACAKRFPSPFVCEQEVEVAGQRVPLYAHFDLVTPRKMFGIFETGNTSHAHEHCLFLPFTQLDADAFAGWQAYDKDVQKHLLKVDAAHDFTVFSYVLVLDTPLDVPMQKRVKHLAIERNLQNGFVSTRLLAVCPSSGQTVGSRMGKPLLERLKPVL